MSATAVTATAPRRATLVAGLPAITATLILLMLGVAFGLPAIASWGWQPAPTATVAPTAIVASAFNTHQALPLRTARAGLRGGGADCTTDATDC